MNLNSIVAGAIGAVNPNVLVGVQVSVGNTTNADGTVTPAYATPGQVTASIGGAFTCTSSGTTLTVSAVLAGSLQPGDGVSGSDGLNALPIGDTIISQLSGTPGGAGTYQLSAPASPGDLAHCTVTSSSTVLNVSAVASGVLQPGQTLADQTQALLPGTMITGLLGATGGPGLYSVSRQQTVAPETMTTSVAVYAQVQALSASDLRHVDSLNLQGSHRAIYINGRLGGVVRLLLKGGDLVTLPDGTVWLVTQPLEPWAATAGWSKALLTLQNGG